MSTPITRPDSACACLSTPSTSSAFSPRLRDAFSLIEVVIAIGVVAVALLGIFGLFSTSLKTNKDSSSQQEGFEVERMLISKFQDTNFTVNGALLSNMFASNYTYATPRTNFFFVYASNTSGSLVTVMTNKAPVNYSTTNGTLYYALILQTSNFPTNLFTKSNSTYQPSDWPSWPSLPVHATVYSIPTPSATNTITNSVPVISFDFIIPK